MSATQSLSYFKLIRRGLPIGVPHWDQATKTVVAQTSRGAREATEQVFGEGSMVYLGSTLPDDATVQDGITCWFKSAGKGPLGCHGALGGFPVQEITEVSENDVPANFFLTPGDADVTAEGQKQAA